MNPCLILTHNNLDLTKRCIESLRKQSVPVCMLAVDNGSTDGTCEWLPDNSDWDSDLRVWRNQHNNGVSAGWNFGLEYWFRDSRVEHVLVVGNDTILAPWTYQSLLALRNVAFVTGVDVGMNTLPAAPDILPLSPHPDFSCFLIRRECWDYVGPFDERMVSYASDCDYHIRAHRLGIPLWKASVPYQHERSSTMNRATPQERMQIQTQANKDRAVFRSIYHCLPGTKEYSDLFKEPCGTTQAG